MFFFGKLALKKHFFEVHTPKFSDPPPKFTLVVKFFYFFFWWLPYVGTKNDILLQVQVFSIYKNSNIFKFGLTPLFKNSIKFAILGFLRKVKSEHGPVNVNT